MTLFGKDMDELEVVAADFLPDGEKLYLVVADADCNLYVLQYDPEGTEDKASPSFPWQPDH
jgi:cleavage and polyadenylation specificity factor subunit 1